MKGKGRELTSEGHHSLIKSEGLAASKTPLLIRLISYISRPLRPPKEAALGFGGEGNQYAHSGQGRF